MTIFLQREVGLPLSHECKLIYTHALLQGIPTRYFPLDQFPTSDCELAVGSVEAIVALLDANNVNVPGANYYPVELKDFLFRRVWKGSILDLHSLDQPVFAKSSKWKQLTGQVFTPESQIPNLESHELLWFSEPVNFVSEYRVYVVNNHIAGICYYAGDEGIPLDPRPIHEAVTLLANTPNCPAGYAIDWGVLSSGQTALVEMNDGFAIGHYPGVSVPDYYKLLRARWDQLIHQPNESLLNEVLFKPCTR